MAEVLPGYDLSRFTCTQCGNCCRVPGYVRLTEGDVFAIAAFMDLDITSFVDAHTRLTDDRRSLSLHENDDGSCVFLADDNVCTINDVKPRQCRGFPFTWRYANVADVCPGVRACRVERD